MIAERGGVERPLTQVVLLKNVVAITPRARQTMANNKPSGDVNLRSVDRLSRARDKFPPKRYLRQPRKMANITLLFTDILCLERIHEGIFGNAAGIGVDRDGQRTAVSARFHVA